MASPDQAIIDVYLELRRSGAGERSAARYLGTTHREIQQYADANPEFGMALEDALAERLERVEERIWKAGQEGDMTAGIKVVESHAPADWTKPSPEMLVRVQQVQAMSADEAADLGRKLAAAQKQQALNAAIDVEEVPDD